MARILVVDTSSSRSTSNPADRTPRLVLGPDGATDPNVQVLEIPDAPVQPAAPVLPGLTLNCTTEEFLTFVQRVNNVGLRPEPAPLTGWQRFVRMAERASWWISDLVGSIFRTVGLGALLILGYLALAYNGYVPSPNWDFLMQAAGIEQASSAPRSTGSSTRDQLDALGAQLGEVQAKIEGIEGKLAEPAPVVEQAPPSPGPAPVVEAPAPKRWRPFAKKEKPATEAIP